VLYHCHSQTILFQKKNPSNHNSLHHVMQLVGLLKVRRYHPLAQQPTWKTTFVSYLSNHFTLQTCTYVIKRNIIAQIYLKKLGGNNNGPSLDYPLLYQLRVLHKLSNYVRGRQIFNIRHVPSGTESYFQLLRRCIRYI